jgi:hypothetical protein
MLMQDQEVLPVQLPLPPRLFDQDTCATPVLSDALPPRLIVPDVVLYVEFDVGEVILMLGAIASRCSTAITRSLK